QLLAGRFSWVSLVWRAATKSTPAKLRDGVVEVAGIDQRTQVDGYRYVLVGNVLLLDLGQAVDIHLAVHVENRQLHAVEQPWVLDFCVPSQETDDGIHVSARVQRIRIVANGTQVADHETPADILAIGGHL